MCQINKGFAVAFAAAELSDAPRTARKLGAALFSGPRLLSVGANLYGRSHPDSSNPNFIRSTHAEHCAILKRRHYEGDNMILYVARRLANGEPGASRPCQNCLNLCRMAGIKRVRFYDGHGKQQEITL